MTRSMLMCLLLSAVLLGIAVPAYSAEKSIRIPLRDGVIHLRDLTDQSGLPLDAILPGLSLGELDPAWDTAIDVSGIRGSILIAAINRSLKGGCRITVEPDALVLAFDPDRLPADTRQVRQTIRVFTGEMSADATAAQVRQMGILLPRAVDPSEPMVVLLHGLDASAAQMAPLRARLVEQNLQCATFSYPSDQSMDASVELLGRHIEGIQSVYPDMPLELIGHSMGGLIARAYVEGDGYAGGVDRLILIATPNAGSDWSALRSILELHEHYQLSVSDPDWNWTWAITDGLGEAGEDLTPGSDFLAKLQRLPRREGVKYTMILGDRSEGLRFVADAIDATRRSVPASIRQLVGMRQVDQALQDATHDLRHAGTGGDGPVSLQSAALEGVTDVVVVHADHSMLVSGSPPDFEPAAWPAIRERLISAPVEGPAVD